MSKWSFLYQVMWVALGASFSQHASADPLQQGSYMASSPDLEAVFSYVPGRRPPSTAHYELSFYGRTKSGGVGGTMESAQWGFGSRSWDYFSTGTTISGTYELSSLSGGNACERTVRFISPMQFTVATGACQGFEDDLLAAPFDGVYSLYSTCANRLGCRP